jgi:hypothetical protein
MKNIITDTNIWYNIEPNEFQNIKENNYNLIVPIIVLNELYTSPNIHLSQKTFDKVKIAIENILRFENELEFIKYNPFEFLIKKIMPQYETSNNVEFYINEFRAFIQLKFTDIKNNHPKRTDISGLTDFINNQSITYKTLINKNNETKGKFKKFCTKDLTEQLILKYANDNLETVNNKLPKIDKLNTDNELLINVFDNLLREVSKTGKKIEDNDWVDIFNLAYVGKNDLYWTKEKSKQKLVIKSELQKYLYENNYS